MEPLTKDVLIAKIADMPGDSIIVIELEREFPYSVEEGDVDNFSDDACTVKLLKTCGRNEILINNIPDKGNG